MRLLSAHRGNLLLLGVVATLGALWMGVARLSQWTDDRLSRHASAVRDVAGLRSALADLSVERAALAAGDLTAFAHQGETRSEATALVQDLLGRLASGTGVQLASLTPLGTLPLPIGEAIGFRVEGEAGLDAWTGLIGAIEAHDPPLVVREAVLRRLSRVPEPSGQPYVYVQLDVLAAVDVPSGGTEP